MAKVRADGQKPHTRLSPWASWHNTTKPEGSWGRVNAAVAHGKLMFLSGEIRTVAAVGASLWDADMEKSVSIFTDG
jgi:hypothetical protein